MVKTKNANFSLISKEKKFVRGDPYAIFLSLVCSILFEFEIVVQMPYSNQEKARFYDWWVESGRIYATFKRRVRQELGRHARVPANNVIKDWASNFRENGTVQRRPKTKTKFVFTRLSLI